MAGRSAVCSSQRSVTKILPSTVPRTFTDFVLISPRTRACSPIVSVPVETIVPSTSPSRSSSLRNLTEPLIETPRERRAAPGTTDGSDCTGEMCRIIGFREAESETGITTSCERLKNFAFGSPYDNRPNGGSESEISSTLRSSLRGRLHTGRCS